LGLNVHNELVMAKQPNKTQLSVTLVVKQKQLDPQRFSETRPFGIKYLQITSVKIK